MAVPGLLVDNREIAARIGVDPDWIAKRTDTTERPWAAPGERLGVAEREGRLHPGDRVLLAAFGGGFTWTAATVEWSAPNVDL